MRWFENSSDWAISSQASWEQDEGSTTRSSNPDRMKNPRAQGLCKQEDIVWAAAKVAGGRIKSRPIDLIGTDHETQRTGVWVSNPRQHGHRASAGHFWRIVAYDQAVS